MSVIPFSFDWADLIGNDSGVVILNSNKYTLKGVYINFTGYVGRLTDTVNLQWGGSNGLILIPPQPFFSDGGFGSVFFFYNRDLCNFSGFQLQGLAPCTLFYPFNGNAFGEDDPENLVVSGSITI